MTPAFQKLNTPAIPRLGQSCHQSRFSQRDRPVLQSAHCRCSIETFASDTFEIKATPRQKSLESYEIFLRARLGIQITLRNSSKSLTRGKTFGPGRLTIPALATRHQLVTLRQSEKLFLPLPGRCTTACLSETLLPADRMMPC
jgi:hypothetical protein